MTYWKRLDSWEIYNSGSTIVTSFEVEMDGEAIIGLRASGRAGRGVYIELKDRIDVASHQEIVNDVARMGEMISKLQPNQVSFMDRQGHTEIGLKTRLGGDGYGAPGGKTVNAATGEDIEAKDSKELELPVGGETASSFMSENYKGEEKAKQEDTKSDYLQDFPVAAEA